MLATYRTQLQRLLLNPQAPTSLYPQQNLDDFVNLARGQLAGENECIRVLATLDTVVGQRVYPFSAIDISSTPGVSGVFNIKQITCQLNDGATFVHARSFQWFNLFFLSKVIPNSGRPNTYAQYAQGASGSIYLDPIPDAVYTLNLDCVCLPIDLVDDTTVEAIPYPWTDCVQFFAAFWAYMSSQRQSDADMFYKRYEEFSQRARGMSNPSVLTHMYPQSQDMTITNKLGVQPSSGGGR